VKKFPEGFFRSEQREQLAYLVYRVSEEANDHTYGIDRIWRDRDGFEHDWTIETVTLPDGKEITKQELLNRLYIEDTIQPFVICPWCEEHDCQDRDKPHGINK
jgi:hypothetical protein|tara:strand:- start:763 stop:1071 length:309 start_codon:yes stop_codon:yes gene_type:complete